MGKALMTLRHAAVRGTYRKSGVSAEGRFPGKSGKPQMDLGIFLPLVADDLPVVVCWTPKAGCTTATKWFLFQTGRLEEALAFRGGGFAKHDELIFGQQTLAVHGYRSVKIYQAAKRGPSPAYVAMCEKALCGRGFCIVKVIRDPAERTASNFAQFLLSAGVSRLYPAWKAFLAWKRSMGLGFDESASFEQFVLFLLACRERRAWRDIHWAPQWHYIQDRYVQRYIPLERFAADVALLESELQLRPSNVALLSDSPHHRRGHGSGQEPCPDAAFREIRPTTTRDGLPGSRDLLTESMRRLIRMAYVDDYAAYSGFYGA